MEMLKEKEFTSIGKGVKRGKTGYTIEKTEKEKKASGLQKENEKLWCLVQNMENILKEQKEFVATLRGGYDR